MGEPVSKGGYLEPIRILYIYIICIYAFVYSRGGSHLGGTRGRGKKGT